MINDAAMGGGHAVEIGGQVPADVQMDDNQLFGLDAPEGGVVTPPTAVMIVTDSTRPEWLQAKGNLTAKCNSLWGFGDGVAVRNAESGELDSLSATVTTHFCHNNIEAQYGYGFDYSSAAGAYPITATNNWWGCASGPGNPGCAEVSGAVDTSSHLTVPTNCEASPLFADGFEIGSTDRWNSAPAN